MKIVIATSNEGKLAEMRALLQPLGVQCIGLDEVQMCPCVAETGQTFLDNALLKARHYAVHTNLPAIADDSGLCVDALDGRPGVYSARYSGPFADDDKNNAKLLQEMKDNENRAARFVCVTVCALPDGSFVDAEGVCEGEILHELRGENGFGYDPLFYVAEYDATFAEIEPELKNKISHRARSLQLLMEKLPGFLPDEK